MANQIDNDSKIQGENDLGYGQNHIVELSNGDLYAAHITDTNVIEVHKSVDSGLNWTLENSFTGLTSPQSLSMCKSENDDLFLGYTTGAIGSPVSTIERRNSAGTWTQVYSVNKGHHSSQNLNLPGFLVTYSRTVNRLYLFYVTVDQFGNKEVTNNYSDDKGDTWSASNVKGITGLSSTTWTIFNCVGLDTDPITGDVYLLWQYEGNAEAPTTLLSKWDSAGSVGSYTLMKQDTADYRAGALVIDSSGNRYYTVYKSNSTQQLIVHKNETVSLTINLTGDDYKRGMFTIGLDGQDNIYIFYVKESDSNTYYRKYNNSTDSWESEIQYTTSQGLRPKTQQHSEPGSGTLNIVYFVD